MNAAMTISKPDRIARKTAPFEPFLLRYELRIGRTRTLEMRGLTRLNAASRQLNNAAGKDMRTEP